MRKIKESFFICFALFFIGNVSAQKLEINQVPNDVQSKFQKEYPTATDVEWKKDGENYKVDFDLGKKDVEVWYNEKAQFVKKEVELQQTDLPQPIKDALSNNYKGYKVDGIKKYVVGNVITFTIELESSKQDWKVTFDKNGKELSKIPD